jgi:hypothetical protein
MPILEPVSGQVGLRFLGKVISGCRDRTAITSVEAVCENPETKSNGRKGADTWVFGAAPGNLCGSATDWWRMQSPSNRSLHLISLLTGKTTAKSGLDALPGAPAERTGRRARGIEINPCYIDVAIKRWQDYAGKAATLAATGQTFEEIADERGNTQKRAPDTANQAPWVTIKETA